MVGRANSPAAQSILCLASLVVVGLVASMLPGVACGQDVAGPIVPAMEEAESTTDAEPDALPDVLPEEEWNPVPPSETHWDWIQLNSDEWLKGSILRLRDDYFEFDSDKMKERTFKWKHIKQIHTVRPRSWGFRRGVVLIGPGVMKGDTVVVVVRGTKREMPRADLISILPGAEKERNRWRAKGTLSAAVRAGNTDQFDLSVDAWARRETARTRLRFEYDNAIGTLNSEQTKNMHRGSVRLDLYWTHDLFFIPGFAEAFHDPFSNIGIRTVATSGVGYHVSRGIFDWVVYGTAGYQYQSFSSTIPGSDPDDHNGVLVLGTTFEWEITGDLDWNALYQVQFAFPTVGDTSQRVTTSLKYDLTRVLVLETAFHWDRVEQPRRGADGRLPVSDDVRLTVGFGVQY